MDAFLAIFRTPSKVEKFTDAENNKKRISD